MNQSKDWFDTKYVNNYVLGLEDIIYEKVIELYLQGYSVKEIAARYAISSVKTGRILIITHE